MVERFPKISVIPAKAGIHFATVNKKWIPAFAGMTIMDPTIARLSQNDD